ncbi:hypothetical protein Taro_001429 [Colocasia esculenta]|uniref:Uncharacterized protein n=1 Tax=Colocasia esculenta TaxID=4460 RepID=A0A843TAV8_COLES|nr:hypothetical protein [Colocasia esculenta]
MATPAALTREPEIVLATVEDELDSHCRGRAGGQQGRGASAAVLRRRVAATMREGGARSGGRWAFFERVGWVRVAGALADHNGNQSTTNTALFLPCVDPLVNLKVLLIAPISEVLQP